MEVEIKSTGMTTTTITTKADQVDEKKKTREQVNGHDLGQELVEEVNIRQEHDLEMEPSTRTPEETRLDSKNGKTAMKMTTDDKKFRAKNPEMTEKEDQNDNLGQIPEKSKTEDPQEESFGQNPEEKRQEDDHKHLSKTTKSHVWDCGSTLYDSFELNSFKRQLDSAISAASARSMSMPHLPNRRLPPSVTAELAEAAPRPPPPQKSSSSSSGKIKPSNKISRSLQKLLKSVFRLKHHNHSSSWSSTSSSSAPSSPALKAIHGADVDRYYVVYDKSGSLTTIPESAETDVCPPEISSLVRKTASERFTAARVVGISCA
ncbi:PREDICTED: uncharacterized protein LOC104809339 [Tarenaya hassleriana]|uniref:uncharacterized protein LOC104809339 n=1 Tax=Tarenaya hassleriana TaxID=28532 RepID=UPI00053C4DFD|nr:PREDICTED: uncharacterized protein LOC104809339 [Tarenaya hassleriana]